MCISEAISSATKSGVATFGTRVLSSFPDSDTPVGKHSAARATSRRFSIADVGSLTNHILAIRADPDSSHPWRGEHANVGVGDKSLAVVAVRHDRQLLYSRT